MIVGFDGTEISPGLRALLTRLQPAGVILFARNIKGAEETFQLLKDCQACVSQPLFTCIDLEGGSTSLAYWVPFYHQRTILWNCNGQPNQNWFVTKQVPGAPTRLMAGAAGPVVPGTGVGGVGNVPIVASGAGNVIAGGIVAAGAGNVAAAGSANIVAAGAGNIVAAGAGN